MGHRPCETSPVPSPTFTTSRSPYAGEFFGVVPSGSSHLPWPSLSLTSSALPGSPCGANISTLQDSLYVTGCGFALLSQEDTTLQHLRSPRSTGCLLRGGLTLTATGLAPASRRQLFRTHHALVRRSSVDFNAHYFFSISKWKYDFRLVLELILKYSPNLVRVSASS